MYIKKWQTSGKCNEHEVTLLFVLLSLDIKKINVPLLNPTPMHFWNYKKTTDVGISTAASLAAKRVLEVWQQELGRNLHLVVSWKHIHLCPFSLPCHRDCQNSSYHLHRCCLQQVDFPSVCRHPGSVQKRWRKQWQIACRQLVWE